ncbi:MAG: hypothetical protein KY455_12765 [Euryarchaeota archaeon]|nr:hypothetical protein [Euryarchaeota archaeon]
MNEYAYIFGSQNQALTETKEVKIRLPVAHLIKLHGLKLVKGRNISDTVSAALTDYFAKMNAEQTVVEEKPTETVGSS